MGTLFWARIPYLLLVLALAGAYLYVHGVKGRG
jgi:hypothetical protein